MRSAKNFINPKALTALYYSLIHSHLIYAIHIWSTCSQKMLNSLYILQKRAIRIIHNLAYNQHTEPYFKKSKILPLPSLVEFFKLQFMQNYVQGFLPISFNDTWTTNANRYSNNRPFTLRNSDELYLPPPRLCSIKKHPYFSFPKAWATFDVHDIKIQRDKCIFNSMLKTHFINRLDENYTCSRLLCPFCHLNIRDVSSDSVESE